MDHQGKSSYEINRRPMNNAYSLVVYLSHRQISWLAIMVFVLIGILFLAGYYVGSQHFSCWFNKQSPIVCNNDTGDSKNSAGYYAQLASFGSRHAATVFVEYLQQKKIIAKVVERKNETVSGKNIVWYQVITERFDTQQELCELLCKIGQEEKLHDIRIIVG